MRRSRAVRWRLLSLTLTLLGVACRQAPSAPYHRQLLRFLGAAASGDSVTMRQLAVSDDPIRWARAAAAMSPSPIPSLIGPSFQPDMAVLGDTTTIVFQTAGACAFAPFVAEFVGRGKAIRIRRLEASCVSVTRPPASADPLR